MVIYCIRFNLDFSDLINFQWLHCNLGNLKLLHQFYLSSLLVTFWVTKRLKEIYRMKLYIITFRSTKTLYLKITKKHFFSNIWISRQNSNILRFTRNVVKWNFLYTVHKWAGQESEFFIYCAKKVCKYIFLGLHFSI